MIWKRIRRDEALRRLPLWLVITALNTNVLMGLLVFRSLSSGQEAATLPALAAVLWLAVAPHLLFGRARVRASQLDLALPVPVPRLWLAHTAAVAFASALLLAASTGIMLLNLRLVSRPGLRDLTPEVLRAAALVAASLPLVVVLLQAVRPGLARLSLRQSAALEVPMLALGWPVALLLLLPLGALGPALPLGLTAALGALLYRRLPAAYSLVPLRPVAAREGRPGKGEGAAPEAASARRRGPASWRLIYRTLLRVPPYGTITPWVFGAFLFAMGFLVSPLLAAWLSEPDLRWLFAPLAAYMLLALVAPSMTQLHQVDPLPVPRRRVFALLVAPHFLALVLGYGAGALAAAQLTPRQGQVQYIIDEGDNFVRVPGRHYGIAWDGQAPRLEAPWGEEHEAFSVPLFRGSRAALYSPFETGEPSSPEFEAWLLSRALAAVYGARVAPDTVAERLFEVEDGRVTGLRPGGEAFLAGLGAAGAPHRGPELPVLLTLVGLPTFVCLALFFATFRASVAEWKRQLLFWGMLALFLAAMIGQMAAAVTGLANPSVLRSFLEILILRVGETGAGTALTWGVAFLLLAGGYLLARASFQRMELPARPSKFTLVEWMS